ncbi:MAG: matrixin family metalloprotease [Candidatus Liptonbacteria bacterium]|nr:matrixin family metalloprotease [Candidatus Liptonbacteria bacterium]
MGRAVWVLYTINQSGGSSTQNTFAHELGHALGLAHSIISNVMYYIQTTQTWLGNRDIEDFNYFWP